jgi:hypothetical protein
MNNTAEKKPNIILRILAFLLTLALVLGAVAAVVYRDRFNLDALRRWYAYRTLERSDNGQAGPFSYEGSSDSLFGDLDGDLLVCSEAAVHIYSPGGTDYLDDAVTLEQPGLTSGGGLVAVYDIGGQELRVFDKRSEAFSLTQEEGHEILSAVLSSGGYLAVTSMESGYKGVVTAYDTSFRTVMSLCLSSRYLMDGAVTGDEKSLAALAVGQSDGAFESSLVFYRLDNGEEPFAECPLGNQVILNLESNDDGLWALGETGLMIVSQEGESLGQYDYGGRYLKNASLKGDGFAALLLGKYRAGSTAELVTVDGGGTELASLTVGEQVLSLSASGRYVAVLTADKLDIYTRDLNLYSSLEGTQSARSVVQRSDGSVFLVSGDTARLYIPD